MYSFYLFVTKKKSPIYFKTTQFSLMIFCLFIYLFLVGEITDCRDALASTARVSLILQPMTVCVIQMKVYVE